MRGLIEHEDGLINSRLTWMLAFNGFLFTAYGLSLAPEGMVTAAQITDVPCSKDCATAQDVRDFLAQLQLVRVAIGLAGVGSRLVAAIGTAAALRRILQLNDIWCAHYRSTASLIQASPIGSYLTNRAGALAALLLPSIVCGIWAFVLVRLTVLNEWGFAGASDVAAGCLVLLGLLVAAGIGLFVSSKRASLDRRGLS
ncbi:MAG: hypothetical protein AAGF60_07355 [Pseudomonadota bacterium]